MKTFIFTTIMIGLLFTVYSCNSNSKTETAATNDKVEATTNTNETAANTASVNLPKGMENILGEWTLVKQMRDENGNHKIDPEDEKTAQTDISYVFKFNADGTCKFETVMDGKYETTTEDDGRVKISIRDLQGTVYPITLYVNSVTENELVLNRHLGGWDFQIFKRTAKS